MSAVSMNRPSAIVVDLEQDGAVDRLSGLLEAHADRRPEGSDSDRATAWSTWIGDAYRRGVESIIDAGRLLRLAKLDLPHGAFSEMVTSSLPFGVRTAERLMAIASNEVLSNPTHVSHLPASWGTLYQLATWRSEELEAAIENDLITPDTRRSALGAIRLRAKEALGRPPTIAPATTERGHADTNATISKGDRAKRVPLKKREEHSATPPLATLYPFEIAITSEIHDLLDAFDEGTRSEIQNVAADWVSTLIAGYAMTDGVTHDQFEAALGSARTDGDLSLDRVLRKIQEAR